MKVKDLIKRLQRMPQEAMVRRLPRGGLLGYLTPIDDVYKEWEPINYCEEEMVVVID